MGWPAGPHDRADGVNARRRQRRPCSALELHYLPVAAVHTELRQEDLSASNRLRARHDLVDGSWVRHDVDLAVAVPTESGSRTVRMVSVERSALLAAFDTAHAAKTVREAMHAVVELGWEHEAFRIELGFDEVSGSVFERPANLWCRAWFELLDGIREERTPRPCQHCGVMFVPNRSNQRHCIGFRC
jgi:hypothetical protein